MPQDFSRFPQAQAAKFHLISKLLEPGWFSHDPVQDLRGRFALALCFFTGPSIRVITRLRVRHWRPGGKDVVDLSPDGFHASHRAKSRLVPLVPTLRILGETYIALSGMRDSADDLLLKSAKANAADKAGLQKSLSIACVHIGAPGALTLGIVVDLFQLRMLALDRHDGLVEYIIGKFRHAVLDATFSIDNPPPEALGRAAIVEAMSLTDPWPELTTKVPRFWPNGRMPNGRARALMRRQAPVLDNEDGVTALARTLLEPGWFSAVPELDARGGFCLALALFTGLGTRRMATLTRDDWRPDGRDVLVIDNDGPLASAKSRAITLVPTLRLLGDRYLTLSGPRPAGDVLFVDELGGAVGKSALTQGLNQACQHVGRPGGLSTGDAGTLFRRALLSADRADGLPEYLVGRYRRGRPETVFDAEHQPSDADALAFLVERLKLAQTWPGLSVRTERDWAAGSRRRGGIRDRRL